MDGMRFGKLITSHAYVIRYPLLINTVLLSIYNERPLNNVTYMAVFHCSNFDSQGKQAESFQNSMFSKILRRKTDEVTRGMEETAKRTPCFNPIRYYIRRTVKYGGHMALLRIGETRKGFRET